MITLHYSLDNTEWIGREGLTASLQEEGIENGLSLVPQFSVYPNPASSVVTIESNVPLKEIRLCDINGKLLRVMKSNELQYSFSVEALTSGIYLMHIIVTMK